MKSRLSCAVAAILSGASVGVLAAQPPPSDSPTNTNGPPQTSIAESDSDQNAAKASGSLLSEVVVTATRRSESSQNVPITMQAFDGQTLQQLHVTSFEDYARLLPNLSSADNGPGQNEIFMRGISAGSQATQASGIIGLW